MLAVAHHLAVLIGLLAAGLIATEGSPFARTLDSVTHGASIERVDRADLTADARLPASSLALVDALSVSLESLPSLPPATTTLRTDPVADSTTTIVSAQSEPPPRTPAIAAITLSGPFYSDRPPLSAVALFGPSPIRAGDIGRTRCLDGQWGAALGLALGLVLDAIVYLLFVDRKVRLALRIALIPCSSAAASSTRHNPASSCDRSVRSLLTPR